MNKFRYKFMSFMQGRYGTDKLTIALIILYAVLGFTRMFLKNRIAGYIISALMFALLGYAVFRMLSKNISARQKENLIFINFTEKLTSHFRLLKDRIRDIKTKRYRRCPNCKNILRLPYKQGKHSVKCPKCSENFSVHIL